MSVNAGNRGKKKTSIVALILAVVLLAGAVVNVLVIRPMVKYHKAEKMLTEGKYEKAETAFRALGNYSDAAFQVNVAIYRQGVSQADAGEYEKAKETFARIPEFPMTAQQLTRIDADMAYDAGDYSKALQLYNGVNENCRTHEADFARMYDEADALRTAKDYEGAREAFGKITGYRDAAEKLLQTDADELFDQSRKAEAYDIYAGLSQKNQTYSDWYQITYMDAVNLEKQDEYLNAGNIFLQLGNYPDAKAQAQSCADKLKEAGNYADAAALYSALEMADKAEECQSEMDEIQRGNLLAQAEKYRKDGYYRLAAEKYTEAGDQAAAEKMAQDLEAEKQYDAAVQVWEALGDAENADRVKTDWAWDLLNTQGNYTEAEKIFAALDHKDGIAACQIARIEAEKEEKLQQAQTCMENAEYEAAVKLYAEYGTEDQQKAAKMAWADSLAGGEEFQTAASMYRDMGENKRANDVLTAGAQRMMDAAVSVQDWRDAMAVVNTVLENDPDHTQANQQLKKAKLGIADALRANPPQMPENLEEVKEALSLYVQLNEKAKAEECRRLLAEYWLAEQKYEEALIYLNEMNQDKDCKDRKYQAAKGLMLTGDNNRMKAALDVFNELGGHKPAGEIKPARDMAQECQQTIYENAVKLTMEEKWQEAKAVFELLPPGYTPEKGKNTVNDWLQVCENAIMGVVENKKQEENIEEKPEEITEEKSGEKNEEALPGVGESIRLGVYGPQDEPIEWVIIEKGENSVKMISKKVLAAQPREDLLDWIEEDFLPAVFTQDVLQGNAYGLRNMPMQKQMDMALLESLGLTVADAAEYVDCVKGDDGKAVWWLLAPDKENTVVNNLGMEESWDRNDETVGVRPVIEFNLGDMEDDLTLTMDDSMA